MSFRLEEKIICTKWELRKLQKNLISEGLDYLYPTRLIRSYYFDTYRMQMYLDSEEGIVPRKKLRIRDYPNENSEKAIETKISSFEGRFKKSKKLTINENKTLLKNGKIDKLYGLCNAKIIVLYQRSYFILKNIRITFDENIKYFKINSSIEANENYNVMEIKTQDMNSKDYLNKLIPYPRRRFSKYSRGCEFLNLV